MTAEKLHDALNLLPSDLIAAADRLRTAPKPKKIPWKRLVPMAACLTLLIFGAGKMLADEALPDHIMMKETAAEAPAAMAPAQESQKVKAEEALPEPPSDVGVPEAPAGEEPAAKAPMEAPAEAGSSSNSAAMGADEMPELYIDHSHRFAEAEETIEEPVEGYCGNMLTTVHLDMMQFTLAGSDSVAITDILINLDYDPEKTCRCMAEFTVDTETLTGIEVNLAQGFARCERGQASLTENQVQMLRNIIKGLE